MSSFDDSYFDDSSFDGSSFDDSSLSCRLTAIAFFYCLMATELSVCALFCILVAVGVFFWGVNSFLIIWAVCVEVFTMHSFVA